MRKLIFAILLAGAAATPALAAGDQDTEARPHWGDHQDSHPDRQQAREERQQARVERQQAPQQVRTERSNGGGWNRGEQQVQQVERQRQFDMREQRETRSFDRSRFERGDRSPQQVETPQQAFDYRRNRGGFTGVQPQQVEQARQNGGWARDRSNWTRRDGDRSNWSGRDGDWRQRQDARRSDGRRWTNGGWNTNWRNDRRYDWRRYRDRNRSIFRLGLYFDPFGYGYRSFDIGYRLAPNYFGQRYWIDPGMYQLPYPPPGTQWVRYWNDAVLVDMYSGEVIDVIHNFFW